MALEEYRRKRHFEETPEPPPAPAAPGGNSFVVQMHDATRLHYDFRLEIDGVLVSWAVPKGPSLNPKDKRLAVQTEEHPLDYGGFEGVIPEGNYGAGPVMVWDHGTFQAEGGLTAAQQLGRGEIKFALHGRKLRGSFALVHTGKRSPDPKARKNWLLIKHRDEAADAEWDISKLDRSALTARTIREIESGEPAREAHPENLPGAKKAALPAGAKPMLATLIRKPFSDPGWIFEIKWDGMRLLARVRGGACELRSRNGREVTSQFPELKSLARRLGVREAILDGEAVVLDKQGAPDFGAMQQRMNVKRPSEALVASAPVVCYLFDVLYANGYDLRAAPLIERKRFLRQVLASDGPVRYSDHVPGDQGEQLFELAQRRNLEGIVGKSAQSRYQAGRSKDWVKLKTTQEVDAVIGGFTAPRGGRKHFGSLLAGLYSGERLRFIGAAGTGFDEKVQASVAARLNKLITPEAPFSPAPKTREKATWVKPELVARIRYTEWTRDGRLRAPVFVRLRPDLDPKDCRER